MYVMIQVNTNIGDKLAYVWHRQYFSSLSISVHFMKAST